MCQSKAEGGRRCPCSGGKRPTPTNPAERVALAEAVRSRRECNRSAAAYYRASQAAQRIAAERWVSGQPVESVRRRLAVITARRGYAAERRVLEAVLGH